MNAITIAGRDVGSGHPCYIVAEIGQNHNGDAYIATRLIGACEKAEVDAVKLCKRHLPSDLTAAAAAAPYVGPQSFGATYSEHRAALELSAAEYAHLKDRIRYNQWPLTLFATACDQVSVDELEEAIDPPCYKVASRDLDNLPLLRHLGALRKPLILSTGMAQPGEIERAVNCILDFHDQIVLLHCVSRYPTDDVEADLERIPELQDRYGLPVGYSDHTCGASLAAVVAVTLGACLIEKHVTLSRAMRGTDHAGSVEPHGLQQLVRDIRAAEQMLQTPAAPADVSATRRKLGRSLVTAVPIRRGEIISGEMLTLKSPGDGIRYADVGRVVGCRAARDLPADVTLLPADLFPALLPSAHTPPPQNSEVPRGRAAA